MSLPLAPLEKEYGDAAQHSPPKSLFNTSTLLPSSQPYSDSHIRDPGETPELVPLPGHSGCSVGTQQAREHTQPEYSPW